MAEVNDYSKTAKTLICARFPLGGIISARSRSLEPLSKFPTDDRSELVEPEK
ncbi:MAG: hypothetical protein WCE61_02695 [Candidatus Acidiferrum sp.]